MAADLPKYIEFSKLVGETPKQSLERLRLERPELKDVKLAYAGRLDPQASGILLVLIGDECKNRDHYQALDKEYEFEILFGAATDTGDIMGMITEFDQEALSPDPDALEQKIKSILPDLTGEQTQHYPIYSSKAVQGKPLWKWAKEGQLAEIEIPSHQITIHKLNYHGFHQFSLSQVFAEIETRITAVEGNFRQQEIINLWQEHLSTLKDQKNLLFHRFTAKVSAGTYIRELGRQIGNTLDLPSLTYSIKRTHVY